MYLWKESAGEDCLSCCSSPEDTCASTTPCHLVYLGLSDRQQLMID